MSLCYKVHESPLMWPDAKVHCESLGARLAVLDTAAKLDVLTSGNSNLLSILIKTYKYLQIEFA